MSRLALVVPVLVLALAGCVAPPPEPTATPTSTPSPTPTEAAPAAPTPRIDLACDDLVDSIDLTRIVAQPVQAADPLVVAAEADETIPRLASVEQYGGLVCAWTNGVPYSSNTGGQASYAALEISILPNAEAEWARFTRNDGSTSFTACFAIICTAGGLAGEYWWNISISDPYSETPISDDGSTTPPDIAAMVSAVASTVAAAAPSSPWTPATTALTLPTECDGLIPPDQAASLLSTAPMWWEPPHGGWSDWSAARQAIGATVCQWSFEDLATPGIGIMMSVPGGASLAGRVIPVYTLPSTPTDLAIAGLAKDDAAWIRCGELRGAEACSLDLVLGGNWVQVTLYGGEFYSSPVPLRDAVIRLGEAIVAGVSS